MKTTIASALSLALLLGASAPSSANGRNLLLIQVNGAKQSGAARIIDNKMIGGVPSVTVTLQLTNAPNLPHEPAHIHNGYCGGTGFIFRSLNFARLVPGTSDARQGIADSTTVLKGITVNQLVGMHSSINVHYSTSPQGLHEVLSCGNIE